MQSASYLVAIKLPEIIDQKFASLIPQQRAVINKMLDSGIVISYSLSLESSMLWIVMQVDDEVSVMNQLAKMPLVSYFKPNIHALNFHHHSAMLLPQPSLN